MRTTSKLIEGRFCIENLNELLNFLLHDKDKQDILIPERYLLDLTKFYSVVSL